MWCEWHNEAARTSQGRLVPHARDGGGPVLGGGRVAMRGRAGAPVRGRKGEERGGDSEARVISVKMQVIADITSSACG